MSKEKELDNLTLDVIECEKAGFGCHYGKWKALQEEKEIKKEQGVPEGWRVCEWCGKMYKPKIQREQKYCEMWCQKEAQAQREHERKIQCQREWRAKQKRSKKDGQE